MFDEPVRIRLAPVLRRITRPLARLGITPHHVTVGTFAVAAAAAGLIAAGYVYAGLALWLVSRVGDGLDGALARETGRQSPFGGYLDITLDMAAYTAMVLGFAVTRPDLAAGWLAVLASYVLVITTTLALSDSARASGRRVSATDRTFQFTPGLTEAGETTVMYVLWVLLPHHLWWLVWLWAAAVTLTAAQRTWLAWRVLR